MRRIIQVGVGTMGRVWARHVAESPLWEAAAYVDPDRRKLMAAASEFGMPSKRCFSTLEAALRTVEADAVLDVTPPFTRRAVCSEAFRHGLDVLTEKPLADTVRNARTLVAEAKKAGRLLMVAQNYRYQALMETARRQLERGLLGDIGYAGITFQRRVHFNGFRETMEHPLILDMAVHHIDLARYLLDTDVRAVSGVATNPAWSWYAGDATAMALLEMENGAPVNYFGSWVAQGWETGWHGHWRLEGAKGVLLLEDDALYFSNTAGRRRKLRTLKRPRVDQAYLLDAFADALETGVEPKTSGRYNLNSFVATHAWVRAVRHGRRVAVRDVLR